MQVPKGKTHRVFVESKPDQRQKSEYDEELGTEEVWHREEEA